MKVLVIYELVPEDTLCYVVENPCDKLLKILHTANGNYINIDDGEGVEASDVINMEACLKDEHLPEDYERQFPGKFQQVDIEDLPKAGPFDMVFHTGFYL